MVRDFKYIIKRIVIGVGIALVLSFLRGNLLIGVSALSFPTPSSVQVTNNNNTQTIYNGTPSSVSWYSATGFSGVDSPYQIQWNQGRFNFWYNSTLCQNKVVTAQVTTLMYSSESSIDFSNSLFRLKVYNGESETACALNTLQQNSKVATWTCIFTNYNNSAFFINNLTFVNNTFGIAIGNDSNYSCSPTTNDMIESNQDQTNQIINSQNNNTTSIIQNNNSNTQTIINNQNENTEKEIESQKVCTNKEINYSNSSTSVSNKFLTSSGTLSGGTSAGWKVTDFYNVSNVKEIIITNSYGTSGYNCFYDSNFTKTSCFQGNGTYNIPSGSNYIKFSIKNYNGSRPTFILNTCINGNQAIVDSQQDINNSLNDTSGGEVSSSWFDDFRDNSSTPVSDLLTMPITLLQAYLNGFSGTCQAMNLGQLYGTYIIIPCINIEDYLGSELWALIDMLFSLYMLYNIGMLCVTIYEGITSLDDDMQFLYSPQHAGAGNSRVERNSDNY